MVSTSGQSRPNRKVYEKLESWRKRELAPVWPYVWLDGLVMKARVAERYQNISLLVAVGVDTDGYREVIGIAPGGQEDRGSWLSFLRWLKDRGLEYIRPGGIRHPLRPGRGALGMLPPSRLAALHRAFLQKRAKMFEGTTAVTFAGLVSSALIASVALERR